MEDERTKRANDLINFLFRPHKTIRDAVHGDIKITALEKDIIDTEVFQRLRYIKQLGTTYLVYPCAKHTRFEHSLGVLFMANRIIEIINANPQPEVIIEWYDKLLIRLCAILHDVNNLPFGHTLEREGKLFKEEWQDKKRLDIFLGEDREIYKVLMGNNILKELNDIGYKEFDPKNVIDEIKKILSAMGGYNVDNLSKPYIADIIGNTLCADLLDYIRRDFYFTGLQENYDDRFLSYLYIGKMPRERKLRLILRLARPSSGRIRRDVLSELLHLLRLRYSLAEKVYYHHAKISTSAMVISATSDMIQQKMLSEDIYTLGDESFLTKLRYNGTTISKSLAAKVLKRWLYKPIYGLKYSEEGLDTPEVRKKKNLIEELWSDPKNRWAKERKLEKQNFVEPGSIVVYCPGPEMGYKAVKTLVDLGNGEIGPLDEVSPQRVKEEMRTSITQKHLELWSMYVFIEPSLDERTKSNIYGDCREEFGLQNEIPECERYYNSNWLPYNERLEDKRATELEGRRLLSKEINMIIERAALQKKGSDTSEIISYEEYCRIANQYISEIKKKS